MNKIVVYHQIIKIENAKLGLTMVRSQEAYRRAWWILVKKWNSSLAEKDRVKTKIIKAFETDKHFPSVRVQCLLGKLNEMITHD